MVLDIARPALSRQVRLLETDLRVALLTRNGCGVVIPTDKAKTAAGIAVLAPDPA